ncbi:MAG: AbrB/MazE/SpoVT family DNA-binding domain-containing protein [Lachnospiraceae bacterium]|nr:AbrB/MazE/SpoVT family DNA-binding domain-containing protein [Lachnospiraceae bacterium]
METTINQKMEQKRVAISSKRQFTIPQKFYSALNFGKEAICTLVNGKLIIEPAPQMSGGEFAEQILAELLAEGYQGDALLQEFRVRQSRIRPAVEAMLDEARNVAQGKGEYATFEDVFGSED